MIVAIVDNNIVVSVQTITDPSDDGGAALQALAYKHQAVVDVTNQYPQPVAGWTLNGSSLVSNGSSSMVPITKLAFRERFTPAEMAGIYAYIGNQSNSQWAVVAALMDNLNVATYIDLTRSDVQNGLELLESLGLITMSRMTAILTTPPAAIEVYKGTL